MPRFPLFVDLSGASVVVVGGGVVAARKIEKLLDFEAKITVISPEICAELRALHEAGRLSLAARSYGGGSDLEDAVLVISATDDKAVNAAVSKDAADRGIPVNVVDDKELSTFYFPALVRRDNVVIGIGSSGESPAQSAALRRKIDAILDDLLLPEESK